MTEIADSIEFYCWFSQINAVIGMVGAGAVVWFFGGELWRSR